MARKIMFKLDAMKPMGLSFNTHVGGTVALKPGQTLGFTLADDKVADDVIVAKYAGLKSLGLTTSIIRDSVPKVEVVQPSNDVKVHSVTSAPAPEGDVKITPEGSSEPEPPVSTDPVVDPSTETVSETPSETIVEDTAEVETWDFEKMRAFVSEKELTLAGRSKQDYIDAIKSFLEEKAKEE